MATRRRQRGSAPTEASAGVLRRRPDGRPGLRKLPPDLEDLATGRRDELRPRRRPKGRLSDSRVRGLVPGVANHEARRVFDDRVAAMGQAASAGDDEALGQALLEAQWLGLWRARSVMGFEALAQGVLGVDPARARELAQAAAARGGLAEADAGEQLPDVAVALWMRSEAALLDHCRGARVSVRVRDGKVELTVAAPLAPVAAIADAVAAIGRSAAGLIRAIEAELTAGMPPQRD
jgi:predicted transcriptional regulator